MGMKHDGKMVGLMSETSCWGRSLVRSENRVEVSWDVGGWEAIRQCFAGYRQQLILRHGLGSEAEGKVDRGDECKDVRGQSAGKTIYIEMEITKK